MRQIMLNAGDQIAGQSCAAKGTQPKWQVGQTWYKADYAGYEALSEVVAAGMLECSNVDNYLMYRPSAILMDGKIVAGCESYNFRAKNEMLISLERLHHAYCGYGLQEAIAQISRVEDRIRYTVDFVTDVTGLDHFGTYLATMISADAFFLNVGRHTGNIMVIRNEHTKQFRLCPLFNHGGAFLSGRKDCPVGGDIGSFIDRAGAGPFSDTFAAQREAAVELYGNTLRFFFRRRDVPKLLRPVLELYPKYLTDWVEQVIYEQMRRYRGLFC